MTGSGFEYVLLAGFTRLGNLLGLLDRQEVPEMKRHRVSVGAGAGGQQWSITLDVDAADSAASGVRRVSR